MGKRSMKNFSYALTIMNKCSSCNETNAWSPNFDDLYTKHHPKGLGSNGYHDINFSHEIKLKCNYCDNKDEFIFYT